MKFRTKKHDLYVTLKETSTGYLGEIVTSPDDAPEQSVFLCQPTTPKERMDNIEKHTDREWDRNQRFDNPRWYKIKLARIYQVIRGWWRVENEDGSELECNNFNKELLYLHNADMIDAVLDVVSKHEGKLQEAAEASEKNLESGAGGLV